VLVTVFGPRIAHKDINFSLALLVTGVSLGAAGLVKTIFGGVGWIFVMGFGAGSGYVLGFAHLHEQASDSVRGRTFAALFSMMRIGLLTSMAIALPLSALFDGVIPGLLSEGSRIVLILGGSTIFLSGVVTMWSVRRVLVELGQVDRSGPLGAASEAFRSYRKSVSGKDPEPTEEFEAVADETDGGEGS
jgi:MFS family permease